MTESSQASDHDMKSRAPEPGTGNCSDPDENGIDAASLMGALNESGEALHLLLENIPDAVFVEDQNGNVLYVNSRACHLHEMTQEELLGTNVLDLVPPEQRQTVAESYSGWRTGELSDYIGYSYTKSGRNVPVEIRASSVIVNGQPVLILNVRDISERLRAETEREALNYQLQHAQKIESLGVMAGGIAHDFNNLLMGILGNTELAIEDIDEDGPLTESLRGIEASAGHAAELCHQMLAYVGQGKSHIERINLSDMAGDLSHLIEPEFFEHAELIYELASDLPDIEGDTSQIQQVLLNLVTNACEALEGEAGSVMIKTALLQCDELYLKNTWLADSLPGGSYVCLEITDHGVGMDEVTLQKSFDPFFTTKITGRGLGLAAVLGIIRGHRGAIEIASSPGDGSKFSVLLPTAPQAASSPYTYSQRPVAEGPITVLVVDDEEAVRSVMRRMLTRMNLSVIESSNGEEAVSVIQERGDEIGCVLLDLSMPKMDGIEAIKRIRELQKDMPVILMSGYDKNEAIGRFEDVELQGFLQKPFYGESLRDAMKTIVQLP